MSLDLPEIPEPPRPKRKVRESNLHWLELTLGVSALIVSFVSIAIALHHGQIMERLVTANSYPYLEGGTSNASFEGERRLSVDLVNRGAGPAHQQSLRITIGEHPVRSLEELFAHVFGESEAERANEVLEPLVNNQETRFVRPGEERYVFLIRRTDANAEYWDRLNAAYEREGMTVEFCYCSVFGECWEARGADRRVTHRCERETAREFMPSQTPTAQP